MTLFTGIGINQTKQTPPLQTLKNATIGLILGSSFPSLVLYSAAKPYLPEKLSHMMDNLMSSVIAVVYRLDLH